MEIQAGWNKKVGFVGFLGIVNSKKYRAMEKRGYLLFFLFGLARVFTFIRKGKDKDVKQHSHRKQENKQIQ